MKLFDPDSPLMSALGTLADLMLCNVLFCLCSLPLFTVGASLTALYDCTLNLAEERESSFLPGQFLRAFRRNFRRGTALWLICIAAVLALWAYSAAVDTLPGDLSRVYRITFFALMALLLAGFQYLFPLQARYGGRVGETLRTAWYLSAAALPWTLCSLAVTGTAVGLSFFLDPGVRNAAVFLWGAVLFAVTAYLNSFLFLRAFRRLDRLRPPQNNP